MTALALIPSLAPVSPPRRAYSASQLKTIASAISNRLYVLNCEFNPIAEAHNRAIDRQIRAITEYTGTELATYIGRHGEPVVTSDDYRYGIELNDESCRTRLVMSVTGKKHVNHCANLKKTAQVEIDKLEAMKVKHDYVSDEAMLAALTDEAVFGISEDISTTVYNRYVADINEAFKIE